MRRIIRDESNVEKDDAGVNRKGNSFPLGQRVLSCQCLAAKRRERDCGGGLEASDQLPAGNGISSLVGLASGRGGRNETTAAAETETRARLRRQGGGNRGREVLKSRHGEVCGWFAAGGEGDDVSLFPSLFSLSRLIVSSLLSEGISNCGCLFISHLTVTPKSCQYPLILHLLYYISSFFQYYQLLSNYF